MLAIDDPRSGLHMIEKRAGVETEPRVRLCDTEKKAVKLADLAI